MGVPVAPTMASSRRVIVTACFVIRIAITAILLLGAACTSVPYPPHTLITILAPTGTLRAAINFNNPLLARRDASGNGSSGIAIDLSCELARRLGIPMKVVLFEAAGQIVAAADSGTIDIAYLAIDAKRARRLDFTAPYLELEGTYLAPAHSALQDLPSVDRVGVRIAVTAGSAYDLHLSRTLKHAQLIHAVSTPASIALFKTEHLDAVAAIRSALVAASRDLPGSRILNGHFMTIPQAVAVPKGRKGALRYVDSVIDELKTSGFIAASFERHGFTSSDGLLVPARAPTGAAQTARMDPQCLQHHASTE